MISKRARALGLIVILLLLAALLFRNAGLAWLALPFLSYLGFALSLAPVREGISLKALRSCEETRGERGSTVEVSIALKNEGRGKIRVTVLEPLMPGMQVDEGALALGATLRPGEEAQLKYRFEARRGRFAWDAVRARISDPFGLFEIEANLKAPSELIVQPHYRKMPSIPLRLQKTLSSPGSIPMRSGGSGTDFWGIREFRQGDPLKRIYWRLNGRNPLRRYTKDFIQERTAEIVLVLDGRQRMELQVGEESLFELEVEALAALAAMLIRQGQRVGLFIIGTKGRSVIPDYGRVQLRRMLNCLAEVRPEREGAGNSLHYLPVLRYSRSAFMIVMSPFAEGDEAVFQRLRALGYEAILISPNTLDFAGQTIAGDAMTAQAQRACRIVRLLGLGRIASLSFPVIDWRIGEDLAGLLERALTARSIATRTREKV
jgi:uncharacterized protein (DUF58 family)